jgi:hypothetical protein
LLQAVAAVAGLVEEVLEDLELHLDLQSRLELLTR